MLLHKLQLLLISKYGDMIACVEVVKQIARVQTILLCGLQGFRSGVTEDAFLPGYVSDNC